MSTKVAYKADWYYDDEAIAASKKLESAGYEGWEVVVANDYTLQIDYDRVPKDRCPAKFKAVLSLLGQRFKSKEALTYEIHRSKSGKGNHVIIHIPDPLEDIERIAWQAAFGSDGVREALNLLRIKRHIKNPVLLFMKKNRDTTPINIKPAGFRKFRED